MGHERSEKEKMLVGALYNASDSELVAERERARELTRAYNDTTTDDETERRELLEELFGTIGEECYIEPPFRCDYGEQIHVGEHFYTVSRQSTTGHLTRG